MTQEQLAIIACFPAARTARNSQFFTKDLGSGTVLMPLLLICQAFLPFFLKIVLPHSFAALISINIVMSRWPLL